MDLLLLDSAFRHSAAVYRYEAFFSGRKSMTLIFLLKNQRALLYTRPKGITSHRKFCRDILFLGEMIILSLPGGVVYNRRGSHQKIISSYYWYRSVSHHLSWTKGIRATVQKSISYGATTKELKWDKVPQKNWNVSLMTNWSSINSEKQP